MRVQDFYPESFRDCFGCGPRNPSGLHISSRLEGDEVVSSWDPDPRFCGAASVLHGGMVAVLMDEVAAAAAFAAYHRAHEAPLGTLDDFDFVTATLTVDFIEPVPMSKRLEIRGRVTEAQGRKIWTECDIRVHDRVVSRGRLLFVSIRPERRNLHPAP